MAPAPGERDLLASLDAAVVATDAAGRVTLWNAAAERIFGKEAADAVGCDFRALAADGGLADPGATALEIALAGGVYAGELTLRRDDGGERTIVCTVSAVRGPDGAVVGTVAVSNDVTEIRRGEDAIRRRHELYRLVLENVQDLVALARPDGRILYASPSHTRLLGWAQDELIGLDALSGVHPEDIGRVTARLAEALESGQAVLEPVRLQRRDGTWVDLEARFAALRDDETGDPLVLSIARDLSETREAEAAALRSQGLFRAVLEGVPDAITVLSRSGDLVYVNRAALDMLGYESPDEVLGVDSAAVLARFELLADDGGPLPLEQLPTRQVFAGAAAAEQPVRYRRLGSGEERWSLVRSLPVRRSDGAVELAITVFHDITESRRAEVERDELLAREHAARAAAEAAAQTLMRLQRLTEVALEHLSLADLLNALLVRLVELLGADTAAILLLDEEAGGFVVRAAVGLDAEVEESVTVPLGTGLAGRMAAEGAIVVDDLDTVELVSPHLRLAGIRSLVGAPLVAEGRVVGVFHVDSRQEARFGPDDARLLELAADRIALAIQQSRLYEAERIAQERLAFLAEASAALSSSLDYERTLANLTELVVPRLADLCAIHVVREDGSIDLVSMVHRDPGRSASAFAAVGKQPVDPDAAEGVPAVIREGRARVLHEVTEEYVARLAADRPGLEEALRALVGTSALAAPLTARGRTYGAITFVCDVSRRRFSARDLSFAEDVASRVAAAIDNARLFREAEERARAARILQSVGDGVLLVDGDGVVRYWNRAAAEITGLPAAAVVDRPIGEAVPGWAAIEPIIQVGAAAELVPLQLRGRELWLSVSGVALEEGTVYAFRDLTEERAIEELRTEFVSTVSHELRTPLAAIYGAAMTLRRDDVQLGELQRENLLDVVASEADRLARTVNDILWASRLDSGMLAVAIESCDPVALAESVVAAQRAHLPAGIELELEAEPGLPPVAADRDKVRQVLVNLLDNAVKYSPDGGRVGIRVHARGGHVRFVVADEGLGIPYAEQRRIFDKFYRLDPDLTRGVGGTGLGLYICRALVRRMHGRIWVDSAPGAGSAFTVELPVA